MIPELLIVLEAYQVFIIPALVGLILSAIIEA
jgi:hypothetical protein